jgi:hypothetical protein
MNSSALPNEEFQQLLLRRTTFFPLVLTRDRTAPPAAKRFLQAPSCGVDVQLHADSSSRRSRSLHSPMYYLRECIYKSCLSVECGDLQSLAVPRRLGISVGFLRPARIDVTRALTTGAKRLPPLPRRGYSPKAVKLWILQSSARPRTQCFCKYRDSPCCCPMNDVGRDKAGSFLQIQRQSSVVRGFLVAAVTLQILIRAASQWWG